MDKLQKKLGYEFSDVSLLENALTHSSYANENRERRLQSNERLEFLGDSVLGVIVAERLFRTYPGKPEGELTRLRAALVCEKSLAVVAQELSLGGYLLLGRGEELNGGRQRPSIIADAVEAVLAAVYLDGGFEAARGVVDRLLLDRAPEESNRADTQDYKTVLQELVQREPDQELTYRLTGESGPDHDKRFHVQVRLNGEPAGEGEGRSKKQAEQAAAHCAIERLFSSQLQ